MEHAEAKGDKGEETMCNEILGNYTKKKIS
jgi:hypothetical protein